MVNLGKVYKSLDKLRADFPGWPYMYNWGKRYISFREGSFDWWQVTSGDPWFYVFDTEWLVTAKRLARRYGADHFYAEFANLYHLISPDPTDLRALGHADRLGTTQFGETGRDLFVWLRYAMLAEERRRVETKGKCAMGKRLKRLGLHQVLWLGMSPEEAADWSRGRRVRELNRVCNKYGF